MTTRTTPSLAETIDAIVSAAESKAAGTQDILDNKTKPRRSLGRIEDLACRFAAARDQPLPDRPRTAIVIMAADHGVAADGVSAYPSEVTGQMVANFAQGGAAINVLARHAGIHLQVVDIGVAHPVEGLPGVHVERIAAGTRNFTREAAMTMEETVQAMEVGIAVAARLEANGYTLVGLGEMGIGNTTAASALTAALLKVEPDPVTGHGTGVDEEGRQRKVIAIRKALELHKLDDADPMTILSKLGGLEIAGLAGLVLGCAARRIPIVADGFITGAAVLTAAMMQPLVGGYLFAGHCSVEGGHKYILRALGLEPILDLRMRLGEGTGAALAMNVIVQSVNILHDMATFGDAGVTDTGK